MSKYSIATSLKNTSAATYIVRAAENVERSPGTIMVGSGNEKATLATGWPSLLGRIVPTEV
jgi:hypothetical protein